MLLIPWIVVVTLLVGGVTMGLQQSQAMRTRQMIEAILQSTELPEGDLSPQFHGPSLLFGGGQRARTRYRIVESTVPIVIPPDDVRTRVTHYLTTGWVYRGRDAEWLYFTKPSET